MKQLDIIEVYERGLADFDSLSPDERDFFVVHNLDLWYEMQGSFEDYFLSGSYDAQINWLADTLLRADDRDSLAILGKIRVLTSDQLEMLTDLSGDFYNIRESRWQRVEQSLNQQAVVIAWE